MIIIASTDINLDEPQVEPSKRAVKYPVEVFKAHQKWTSGTLTIYTENLTAMENCNVLQLIPPQDLEVL